MPTAGQRPLNISGGIAGMSECPKCSAPIEEGAETCPNCCKDLDTKPGNKPKIDIPSYVMKALKTYWPMLVAGVLFIVMQWGFPFIDWWKSWNKPNSYYSHGPLVPLIALFMVWANRKRLALVKIQPSWLGLALIIPSIFLYVFGRWTGSGNLCAITFLTFLIGGVLMFTGARMTRLLLFPMLYLVFMVPAPSTLLDTASSPVQRMSTTLAAKVLHYSGKIFSDSDDGWGIRQAGNLIYSPRLPAASGESEGVLRVEGECSGFRMLISLITFTAFFVYMLNTAWWKKVLLVGISLPLSLFVNGLRIAVIGYVGIWTDNAEKMFKFHDSWAMVFELVLSFAILFGIARLINAVDFGIPDPVVDPETAAKGESARQARVWSRPGLVVMLLFCVVVLTNFGIKPLEATAKGELDRANFPERFGTWESLDREIDTLTETELKTADMLSRVYINRAHDVESAAVLVQAARDTDAFHDPHSCIPGGGAAIEEDRVVTINFDKPRPFSVKASCLRIASPQTGDSSLLVYWYSTDGQTYPRTSQVRLVMRKAQLNDLRTIAKSWFGIGSAANAEASYATRQSYCYRFQAPTYYEDTNDALKRLTRFIREFVASSPQFE